MVTPTFADYVELLFTPTVSLGVTWPKPNT
jgi:hypothetical protein